MLTITKKFEFEAAHFLPDYEGKCKNPHGHTFKLEIEISRNEQWDSYKTMILDFGDLKEIVKQQILDRLDHTMLNDVIKIPTSEVLVGWIVERLKLVLGTNLESVRLYETSNSYCTWRKD